VDNSDRTEAGSNRDSIPDRTRSTGRHADRSTRRSNGASSAVMGVVVVNYASHRLLEANLAGLASERLRIVVVDNQSTATERAAVVRLAAANGWEIVLPPGNKGFGAGVNLGVTRAVEMGCETLLILNPDAIIGSETIRELHVRCLADPLALITPTLLDSTGSVVFAGSVMELATGHLRAPTATTPGADRVSRPWLTGACLALHVDLFAAVAGFDESFFLYWEDVDFSFRVMEAGGRLVVAHNLVAVHDEGGTQGRSRRAKSNRYYYYNCRNRLLFAAKRLDRRTRLRWITSTPLASWAILVRGGRRQLLHSPWPAAAAIAGTMVGLMKAAAAPSASRRLPAGRPIRRALLAHPGAELYGSDRVLIETAHALVADGWDVTVALPQSGPLITELWAVGATVTLCRVPVLRKSALRPAGALGLVRDALLGLSPAVRLIHEADVVYVNTTTIPSWLLLGRLLGRPVICHVHEAESSARPTLRRLMSFPVLASNQIIVNSRFSADVLAESVPSSRRKAVVLYNGVRGPSTATLARSELVGPVRMLFIGRLSPRKGPQMALAALLDLCDRGLDAHLSLLGAVFPGYEWFEKQLLETVRAAEMTDRVEFLGFRDDIWPELAASDIVLVPSQVDEPFGNTAVEAMLAARPLVVSDTSGLREAAEGYETAEQVRPDDASAWADAVERIVGHWRSIPRAAMGDSVRAGQRHAPTRYRHDVADLVDQVSRRRIRR